MTNSTVQQTLLTVPYGTGMYDGEVQIIPDPFDPFNPYAEKTLPHGKGTMLFSQDASNKNITDIYVGQWSDGVFSGPGKLTTDNSEYDGSWVDGKKQGHGKLSCSNGKFKGTYEGWFQNNQRQGTGTMTWNDGRTFSGTWNNNTMKQGSCRWPEGDSYVGDWDDYKFHGKGVYRSASGNSYDGDWNEGVREGYGKQVHNGDKYEGYFSGDYRNTAGKPQATLTFASGDVYKGEFKGGRRNGHGEYTTKDGITYKGKWKKNKWGGDYKLTKARTGKFIAWNTVEPGAKPAGVQ